MYTVRPRLDVLTSDQRGAVLNTADQSQPLTVGQANALLSAIVSRGTQHPDHGPASDELRRRGILHADHRPDSTEASGAIPLPCADVTGHDGYFVPGSSALRALADIIRHQPDSHFPLGSYYLADASFPESP